VFNVIQFTSKVKMARILRITCFFCLIMVFSLNGQSEFKIGQWRSYLPFSIGKSVSLGNNKVYYGTESGLLTLDRSNDEVSFFTKEDGLSEVDIKLVRFNSNPEALVIVYENSNIDLIFDGEVINKNNIFRNNSILGSKEINQVYTDDGPKVYLACDFGLVELDLTTQKFGFTLFTNDAVTGFTKFQNQFYISTLGGVYRYDPAESKLIQDLDSWTKLGALEGLPTNYSSEAIAVFGDRMFAGVNGDLYVFDGEWILFHIQEGFTLKFISPEGTLLMAGFSCDADCRGRIYYFDETGVVQEAGFNCTDRPTYVIEDDTGNVWYADNFPGFRIAKDKGFGCERQRFNTPYSRNVSDLIVQDDILYVATGGVNQSFTPLVNRDGFYIFRDGIWEVYNQFNNEDLANTGVLNFYQIMPLPDHTKVFVATYATGLLEYDFNEFKVYDQTNSIVQGAAGDDARERIAGLALDKNMNLWMTNYLANQNMPILVRKNDGTFSGFNPSCTGSTLFSDIIIDQRGYKWIIDSGNSAGIIVFNDNGTIDDPSDDRCRVFNSTNSELPTNRTLSIAMDLDGDIWVGTEEGPVIFDGAADIFDGPHAGFRIKIDQEGIIAFLLSDEEILSIGIDGANRKWFGTRNGVFVQSANGEDQIAYLNATNSPLLNDQINDIAINQKNGVVYLGTNDGIISIRTDATLGTDIHNEEDIYAFPNPVRENYDGPIAIRGLARDANVKITDAQGNLIFETIALGGQAIWDGRNFDGRRASTGVYLVYSTAEGNGFTKPDAIVTKILLIK